MLEFPRAFRNHEISCVEVRRFTMSLWSTIRFDFELMNLGFGFIFWMEIPVLHSAFMIIWGQTCWFGLRRWSWRWDVSWRGCNHGFKDTFCTVCTFCTYGTYGTVHNHAKKPLKESDLKIHRARFSAKRVTHKIRNHEDNDLCELCQSAIYFF